MTLRHARFLALALALTVSASSAPAHACPTHEVKVPTGPGNGDNVEVKPLLDTPFVKLVSITLRKGTVLAKHSTKDAITLQAVSGSGKVRVGKNTDTLSAGRVVLVAPGAEHEVTPDGKQDLVLLVHFLTSATGGTPAAAEEHACTSGCSHDAAKPAAAHKH